MPAILRLTLEGKYDQTPPISLDAAVTTIGRAADNVVALSDQGVSRYHARIVRTPQGSVIEDLGSDNGVVVGGVRVSQHVLQAGDIIQLGYSRFQFVADGDPAMTLQIPGLQALPIQGGRARSAPPAAIPMPAPEHATPDEPVPPKRRRAAPLIVLVLVVAAAGFVVGVLLARKGSRTAAKPFAREIVPPPALAPTAYADTSRRLAAAVGELNRQELALLESSGGDAQALDRALREIGAAAIQVATLAEDLGRAAARQEGSSVTAVQLAEQYRSISRLGYALAFETAEARDAVAAGGDPEAARAVIAEYGARLHTPSPSGDNPFFAYVRDESGVAEARRIEPGGEARVRANPDRDVVLWMASSADTTMRKLTLPERERDVRPVDRAELDRLATAAGQADTATVRRAAFARLADAASGAAVDDGTVRVLVPQGVAVQSAAGPNPPPLVSYPNGRASAVERGSDPGSPTTTAQYDTGAAGPPTPTGTVLFNKIAPVDEPKLEITRVNRPPDQRMKVQVDVKWDTSLTGEFVILCYATSGSTFVTHATQSPDGRAQITVDLTRDQSAEIGINCSIRRDKDSPSIQSIEVVAPPTTTSFIDAGPPPGVTIDAAARPIAPIDAAVARAPVDAAPRKPAGDTSWIAGHVEAIRAGLVNAGLDDTTVAIVLAGYSNCLYDAAPTMDQAAAKAHCNAELKKEYKDDKPQAPTGTITVNASFAETVSRAGAKALGSNVVIIANFKTGAVDVSIAGGGSHIDDSYYCWVDTQDNIVDRAKARWSYAYEGGGGGGVDPKTFAFSAKIAAMGQSTIDVIQAYTHEKCTHLKLGSNHSWQLDGTISGTLSPGGRATFTTNWKGPDGVTITGTWSGTGAYAP